MKLNLYAPVTRQPVALARAQEPRRRRLAKNGYVTYLRNPWQHTNSADSHAGYGATPEESYAAAVYWANQTPWVVTVRFDRAPRWAQEEAQERDACFPSGEPCFPE